MFTAKKQKLFDVNKKDKTSETNSFVEAGLKKSAETLSQNGALKYSTTGNPFVDQFGLLGNYKTPRSFNEISKDCEILWGLNPLLTVVFILYIRTISRVTTLLNGIVTSVPQKGAELKHESIMRMIWLHIKAPNTFWKNIGLFISVGSWKDIITMLSYDLQYNGWDNRVLNWDKFGSLILSGLDNKNASELLKKYLPTIKSNNSCTTIESQADNLIGKWICSLLYGNKGENSGYTYKKYRKLKSSGTAHQWQQLISKRQFEKLDFNTIHGRALNLLVKGKFLKNQNLQERYNEWISSTTKPVKYTGFVHELFEPFHKYRMLYVVPIELQKTINAQFETLVKKGGEKKATNFIVVRDTSGSMSGTAKGTNMSAGDIAKALALYFSEFLTGYFSDSWIEFNSAAKMHKWKGNNPVEKWFNDNSDYIGNTDFQSVIDLFCRIKREGVSESEFPTGILCISDGEFDLSSLGKTNVDTALMRLREAGFSEEYVSNFVIVLWNIQTGYGRHSGNKFETFGNVPNVFYFSGYSPSVISFLTSEVKNAEELFLESMNQEILNMVEI